MSGQATESGEWTVKRLLDWTIGFLNRKGLDQPQLCAQLLLAHALACERLELYLRFEATPEAPQLDVLRELVRRASEGEPIAHLIGKKEFYSLELQVGPDVLIPRPETETLVAAALDLARGADRPAASILELGTGSGCVAAALAVHLPDVRVVATDLSPEALRVAEANLARHGLDDRVELHQGDLFDAVPDEATRFGMVVSNPPYVRTDDLTGMSAAVARHEPRIALDGGPDGLDTLRRIIAGAPARLEPGGWLALEMGYDQASSVRPLVEAAGLADVCLVKDGLGHPRVIAGRRP